LLGSGSIKQSSQGKRENLLIFLKNALNQWQCFGCQPLERGKAKSKQLETSNNKLFSLQVSFGQEADLSQGYLARKAFAMKILKLQTSQDLEKGFKMSLQKKTRGKSQTCRVHELI